MSTKRIKSFLLSVVLGICIVLLCTSISFSQETGLGYSEAPFPLIEDAENRAVGDTAIEAVQAASAGDKLITLDQIVEEDSYAFMTVMYNDIGISAVTQRSEDGWQFICRAGGLMQAEELTERCHVPSTSASSLYMSLLEVLSNNVQR